MNEAEWTQYATSLVLSAHAHGVAQGYREAAKLMMAHYPASEPVEIAKELLRLSIMGAGPVISDPSRS